MAIILEFPIKAAQGRRHLESKILKDCETDSPEMRKKKCRAVMEMIDRITTPGPVSITIDIPAGEPPLTPGQTKAVSEAMEKLNADCSMRAEKILREAYSLQK